jgi:hypothetical protein
VTGQSISTSITTVKEKKGFRLNIFKSIFGKSKKSSPPKQEPVTLPQPGPPSVPNVTVTKSDSTTAIMQPPVSSNPEGLQRRPTSAMPQRKSEQFQFSMQPVPSRIEGNKGIKERPTPSAKTIEKFSTPSPVVLPRLAHSLVGFVPSTESTLALSEDSKWRYAGRALAEWELIVKQCDSYVESVAQRDGAPAEGIEGSTAIHIPRMTVELPKFYFTGKTRDGF